MQRVVCFCFTSSGVIAPAVFASVASPKKIACKVVFIKSFYFIYKYLSNGIFYREGYGLFAQVDGFLMKKLHQINVFEGRHQEMCLVFI